MRAGFAILADEDKVAKKAEKQRLKKEEMQAKLSLSNDEVKGRAWADVSDDEEDAKGNVQHIDSSDDEQTEVDPESPARSPVRSPVMPTVAAGGYPAAVPKNEQPQLSKKAKKAQKKQELDDLDSVLAEFGVGLDSKASKPEEAQAQPGEGKRSKKKKKAVEEAADAAEGGEVNGRVGSRSPEPTTRSPEVVSAEPSDADAAEMAGMDDKAKAAALEALKKKAAAKKGGNAKSATAAAAAEAKKRAANAAKPKRDKNAFDR